MAAAKAAAEASKQADWRLESLQKRLKKLQQRLKGTVAGDGFLNKSLYPRYRIRIFFKFRFLSNFGFF